MAEFKTAGSRIVAAVIALVLLAGASELRAGEGLVTGIVRDSVGRAVEDVEIYVLPEKASLPVARGLTRADGRYLIEGVPPGIYRIAGIKAGYLAVFGRLNTSFRSSLDLLLAPAPRPGEPGSEQDPGTRTWVLRLPARSVLRDVESTPLARDAEGAGEEGAPLRPSIEGQVDQLIALGGLGSGTKNDAAIQGTETRLRLGGALGQRGNLRLRGRHESFDATRAEGDPRESSARKAADLFLDLSYDPTSDTNLKVKSYYARQDLLADAPAPAPQHRSERAWGCEARWAKQITTRSRIDVGVHYLDALVETPTPTIAPDMPLSNRTLGTQGSFESVTEGGHQLQFGFRARGQVQSETLWPSLAGVTSPASPAPGWSLGLDASDAWSISARASLLYGLGYYQPLDLASGASMAVPKLGALWSGARLGLRGVVSYYGMAPGDSRFSERLPRQGSATIGYEGEAQVPLPSGFVVRGEVSFAPAQYYEPFAGADFEARPLYVTNGDAAYRRAALALERTVGGTTTSLTLARSSADGMVSVQAPFHGALGALEDEQVRFQTGRLGVRIAPSGTELAAEYRWTQETARDSEGASSERRFLELRVAQDLARLQSNGSYWRLLLVAREAGGMEDRVRAPREWAALAESGREVSAGVSVAF